MKIVLDGFGNCNSDVDELKIELGLQTKDVFSHKLLSEDQALCNGVRDILVDCNHRIIRLLEHEYQAQSPKWKP